jgi:hypothetical protein
MKGKSILLIIAIVLALSACAGEPETIIETVVHEATVEVLQTVEVTRQVEVIVEVTRQVEVIKEVPLEVTRLVEVVITATPEPTQEPTPTNTPVSEVAAQPAMPPAPEASPSPKTDVAVLLLQASLALQEHIYNFRDHGMATGNCDVVVENQDNFLAAPSFDVSGTSDEVRWAYDHYQTALELAKDAALGISEGCRNAIETQTSFSITGFNYNDIRGKLDRAIEEVKLGIDLLQP